MDVSFRFDAYFFIFFLFIFAHVMMCPFTKVEESFYVQAAHDFIFTKNISNFDHQEFPGAVPRTAVPIFILSMVLKPLTAVFDKQTLQICLRLLIGGLAAFSLRRLAVITRHHFGRPVSFFFMILTISQPHLLFYASRTLPNSLALPLVLLALSNFPLSDNTGRFIQISAFCILIVRCELALLMGFFLILGLLSREISIPKLLVSGSIASVMSIGLTVPFDSFFWGDLIWPEGSVFHFNAIKGGSSAWGVSPFLWYFKSALPRSCLTGLIFLPAGFLKNPLWAFRIAIPSLLFVLLYSFNPHKELRFIIYIVPMLNIVSAVGIGHIYEKRNSGVFKKLLWLATLGCLAINFAGTGLFTIISSLNYPGGVALEKLHEKVPCSVPVTVHISNLAAQTGVTRFGQLCENWTYDKTENLTPNDLIDKNYTHLIVENNENSVTIFNEKYKMLATVAQYSHIRIEPLPPQIAFKEALVVLERRDFVDIVPKDLVYENNWIRTSEEL